MPCFLGILLPFTFLFFSFFCKVDAQVPFVPIDSNYLGNSIIFPKEMRNIPLFTEGDIVVNDAGEKTLAKGMHSSPYFFSDSTSSKQTYLLVPHQSIDSLHKGKGGGATIFKLKQWEQIWQPSGSFFSFDFSEIGGTSLNSHGIMFSGNKIMISENKGVVKLENPRISKVKKSGDNSALTKPGWIVEGSLDSKKGMHKIAGMGRFNHYGFEFMPDSLTVYLTNDDIPAVFFKYIALKKSEYEFGQLYAYKQSSDGFSGFWIPMSMSLDSLSDINNVALRAGATFFMRLMGITRIGQKLYICENGKDDFRATTKNCFNGSIAMHNNSCKKNEEVYDNPFGAILEFDIKSDQVKPLLWGNKNLLQTKIFTNPASVSSTMFNDKSFLIIHEQLPDYKRGRTTYASFVKQITINESWWLDLSTKNPSIDNLYRFLIAPENTAIKGGNFSDDNNTYFYSLQCNDPKNKRTFKSGTYGISGFNIKEIREKRGN